MSCCLPAVAHAPCHCQARASEGKCTACEAGKHKAGNNTKDCSFCPAGKYSGKNATVCIDCAMPTDANEFDLKCVDRSLRAPSRPLLDQPIGDATGNARRLTRLLGPPWLPVCL